MGAEQSKPIQMKIGTLNYSGILKSPYEFYEKYDKEEMELSNKMKTKFEQHKGEFAFSFANFEKEWQDTRYSPLYIEHCGIKHNIYMMSKSEFEKEWDNWRNKEEHFLTQSFHKFKEKTREKEKKASETKPKEEKKLDKHQIDVKDEMNWYLNNLRCFDTLIYQRLVEDIYREEAEVKEIKERFFSNSDTFLLDSRKYRENRRAKFSKSFLNEKSKIAKTINAIIDHDLDVLFIQEANELLVRALEQKSKRLHVVRSYRNHSTQLSSESIIVIKQNKEKFPKFKTLIEENSRLINNVSELKDSMSKPRFLGPEDLKRLNLNNDTVVQFLYNIVLINPHLSSKDEKNSKQIQDMKYCLQFLKQTFPTCHIILGGDLNTSLMTHLLWTDPKNNSVNHRFNVVPADCKLHFTCYKKRTSLQAQQDKADDPILEVKDYIISDLPIESSKILVINGDPIFEDCTKKIINEVNPQPHSDKSESANLLIHDGSIDKTKAEIKPHVSLPLLPSDNHPYDHYLLIATVQINDRLEHVTDIDYRFKYRPESLTQDELKTIYHEREKRGRK